MQRTRFADMVCSIARSLDVAGEPWSPLIIRDVWVGITRFHEMQHDLGISSLSCHRVEAAEAASLNCFGCFLLRKFAPEGEEGYRSCSRPRTQFRSSGPTDPEILDPRSWGSAKPSDWQ